MSLDRPPRTRRSRLLPFAAVAAVAAIVTVSGCGGSERTPGAASNAITGRDVAPAAAAPLSDSSGGLSASGARSESAARGGGIAHLDAASLDRAQVKRAEIALRSDRVATVVSSLESIAASTDGYIDSENTSTDTHGVAQSSLVTLRVPVGSFATSVDSVARLGSLLSKKTTTVDVTGQVADVASRVASAKDSIAQLRLLFSHATKLGDIITLESELSSRESDLEALEAQQRVLAAETTMSTISVSVTRAQPAGARPTSDDHAGFLGGLRQGWDALVGTMDAVAHGIGAALPFAVMVALLALLGWSGARRLPRRRASTHG